MERLSINAIIEYWKHPTLTSMSRDDACLALLPDAYNWRIAVPEYAKPFTNMADITHNEVVNGKKEYNTKRSLAPLRKFMHGNVRSPSDSGFGCSKFTKDLRTHLNSDTALVCYLDSTHPEVTYKVSMLNNIGVMVRSTYPALNKDSLLFTQLHVTDGVSALDEEYAELRKLQTEIDRLLQVGNEAQLRYAVFLMLLVAIFHREIETLGVHYRKETIDLVLGANEVMNSWGSAQGNLVVFGDPDYMNDYRLYLYRPTRCELYNMASLRFEAKGDSVLATLRLTAENETPISGAVTFSKTYTGTPMLSVKENIVYIALTEARGGFAFLTFQYTPFSNGPMYYRTGFFITVAPKVRGPQFQKIAIVAKQDLTSEDEAYIRGLLQSTGDIIHMTEDQMADFRAYFKDYPWFSEFDEKFSDFMESHKKPVYWFRESEILSFSGSNLSEDDLVRVMLALKSQSQNANRLSGQRMNCTDPDNLHNIMR